MLSQIAIGSALLVATVLVHAAATRAVASAFGGRRTERWHLQSAWGRVGAVGTLVLMMFLVSIFEAWLWALAYIRVGAMPGLEEALYFSIVTFTTLGYGDVTLHPDWRLLASFEAANGTIMFGWTTAVIVALVRTAFDPTPAANSGD